MVKEEPVAWRSKGQFVVAVEPTVVRFRAALPDIENVVV